MGQHSELGGGQKPSASRLWDQVVANRGQNALIESETLPARQPRPIWLLSLVAAAQVLLACLGGLFAAVHDPASGPEHARLSGLSRTPALSTIRTSAPAMATAGDESALIRLQDLSPEEARRWNAANPVSRAPNPPARPFHLKAAGALDEARALDCLTAAVYYEAALESVEGQRAVAQVVLNRMRHPAFPKSVCGVVFQGAERTTGCQFTFTCDGSLRRDPEPTLWERSRGVARAALNGYVMRKVGNATHYHAVYVAPYWSPSLAKVGTIGAHVFYRWTGGWGLPPAFSGSYQGAEQDGRAIASLDRLGAGAEVAMAETPSAPPAEAQSPQVEVSPAETITPHQPEGIVSAAEAATDAVGLVAADDLNWAGQLKDRPAPRIAAATF